ncbi:PREDICTED: uncharacterized protein LOC104601623 [Nelumbo nucifera]|uniref:Uncharacterized protein LOC104601623 n=1 Tax=Nelumbo nucifera TaxID=4432 RepID=A0A1U8AL35_NELNU|nr:PREDICTED: uncharacterized protein LOC104601623 [Nelumbo nucifera]XP_010263337.1 PREDICTED: uncharacterized protein LOC104601623 [Nelumbo nucifera]
MDDILADDLFGSMKIGKNKKRASKKARIKTEATTTKVIEPEHPPVTEQPPVIDLVEEDLVKATPPHIPEETTSLEHVPTTTTSTSTDAPVRSILTLKFGLLKSKDVVFTEEVTRWADLPVAQLGARATTHCMVVNSSIHALAYQSEVNLKRALEAEESSRNAHTELNLARSEINQLKNDMRAKKELLTLLITENELEEREAALKREIKNLKTHVRNGPKSCFKRWRRPR